MEFNLGSKSTTLVGNWQENRSLEESGGVARVMGKGSKSVATRERVMPVAKNLDSSVWLSESRDAAKSILSKATLETLGPRARLQQQSVTARADAFATALLAPTAEAYVKETTAAVDFAPYAAEHYVPPQRRAQLGAAAPPPSMAGHSGSDVAADVPVTYYTQRLVEGVFHKGAVRNGNPFAKSFAFSNPIEEAHRPHAETVETADPEATTYLGRSMAVMAAAAGGALALDARIPGASQALHRLFVRFLRRLAESPGAAAALGSSSASTPAGLAAAHCCLPALLQDLPFAVSAGEVGDLSKTASGAALDAAHVSQEMLRRRLHALRLALPEREAEGVIAALDDDGSGRVSLPLLLQQLLATIPPPRVAAIQRVFSAATGGTGGDGAAASVAALAGRFQPLAVVASETETGALLRGFLGYFVELGCTNDAVDVDTFTAFFSPISACVDSDSQFTEYLKAAWGLE